MDKTTQDLAWSVLPKEFKEEVKFEYHRVATKASKDEYDLGFMHTHERIFGIHNLTSDAEGEPKAAEPKYHVGDWVRVVSTDKHGHVGQITEVEYEYGCNYYQVSGTEGWHFLEKNLEPYTEPEKNHIPNPAKIVDDILKDGFHEHNRLHVAAMAMQGMLSNTTRFSSYEISDLVRISLNCADALLAECESSAQSLCHAKKGAAND